MTQRQILDKIHRAAAEALYTDGARQKQWYLERIAELSANEEQMEAMWRYPKWERGIAP